MPEALLLSPPPSLTLPPDWRPFGAIILLLAVCLHLIITGAVATSSFAPSLARWPSSLFVVAVQEVGVLFFVGVVGLVVLIFDAAATTTVQLDYFERRTALEPGARLVASLLDATRASVNAAVGLRLVVYV